MIFEAMPEFIEFLRAFAPLREIHFLMAEISLTANFSPAKAQRREDF